MSDEQLKGELGLGPSSFQKEAWEIYKSEAEKRGIVVNDSEIKAFNQKNEYDEIEKSNSRLIKLGILSIFAFMGLFSFIPGYKIINNKRPDGELCFDKNQRMFGGVLIGISVSVWIMMIGILLAK